MQHSCASKLTAAMLICTKLARNWASQHSIIHRRRTHEAQAFLQDLLAINAVGGGVTLSAVAWPLVICLYLSNLPPKLKQVILIKHSGLHTKRHES